MPLFSRSSDPDEGKPARTRTLHSRTPEAQELAQYRGRSQQSQAPGTGESTGDTEERYGLFELWPNTPPNEAPIVDTVLDIVAVHGLGGHPRETWTETWTEKRSFWLQDFLPKAVPDARILTLGYNASVAFGGTAARLDEFATTLLNRLLQKRRQYKDINRPIIFICHSLGGIVFKRALVMAHLRSARYGSLCAAIKSVIFLGTPHRGADIASWSMMFGRIANVALLGAVRTDLLRPKSELLMTVASDFVEKGAALTIFSIYEQKFIPPMKKVVVDKDSAILNLPNETPIPIEADHRSICKFLTPSSEAYATVFDCLSELIDAAKGLDNSFTSIE